MVFNYGASLWTTSRVVQSLINRNMRRPRSIPSSFSYRTLSAVSSAWGDLLAMDRPTWTQEWKELGFGCALVEKDDTTFISNLFFVQMGFGVDQHGGANATKAAIRAVRNAIEFNSIPGVIEAIPGGRKEMLIQVKLGIPPAANEVETTLAPMRVDPLEVAKVFPYGRLLPIETVVGGLSFSTGRLVPELGDADDMAICVAACVSIGYNNNNRDKLVEGDDLTPNSSNTTTSSSPSSSSHTIYSTLDGF